MAIVWKLSLEVGKILESVGDTPNDVVDKNKSGEKSKYGVEPSAPVLIDDEKIVEDGEADAPFRVVIDDEGVKKEQIAKVPMLSVHLLIPNG